MVFRKFKPLKQWGKHDTRIFKEMLKARNKWLMPKFNIPSAVQECGFQVYDPNDPKFYSTHATVAEAKRSHPTQHVPSIEIWTQLHKSTNIQEHPLYKRQPCALFDGTASFTDGIDQACALTNAVKRVGFPSAVLEIAEKLPLPDDIERHLDSCIMHGERYDPTLEKLPKFFDPVIFWANYYPNRMHGTPLVTRGNIILDNLYRTAHLLAIGHSQLERLRCDRNVPLSALTYLPGDVRQPFVVRSEPHLVVQSAEPIKPWIKSARLKNVPPPDITPIGPTIDLTSSNIYNDTPVMPRISEPLFLDTIIWCREQSQKYPWTIEEWGANAVMVCFGAALAQACRNEKIEEKVLDENPVVVRAVQLVKGRLDLVVYQLNTMDLKSQNRNIVWIEPGLQLYKPGKFTENYDEVVGLDTNTFRKFMALLLVR